MYKIMMISEITSESLKSLQQNSQITCFLLLKALNILFSVFYVEFFVKIITFIKNFGDLNSVRT